MGSGLLYRTGDLATYREDGTIEYLGRFDSQIKLRGFRIEPGEIESVLCQQSQVERAVVMLQEEGGKRELVGYVTALASDLNDVDKSQLTVDLKRRLKQSLPGYMHLAHIVVVDQLPLTVNGKIDRQALPIPTVRKSKEERVSTGPLDRKETILLEIWQQILSSRDISIDENFFDLGGDSISGMQIVSKARENGLKLTPTQLFEHQTIAEQAAVATEIQAADTLSTPAPGPASLGPIQQNFFAQTPSNPHHYNQAVMLAVQHDTNITVLQSALEQLATHHDSLRLRFTKVEGQWQQQYAETITVPLDEFNITSDIAQSVDEIIAGLQASLHLSEGPLFRGALLTRESGKFLLLIAHHLVVDGVSWRLLIEDLSKMYQQITRHEPVSLPAKTTAFSHWTAHLKKHASRFAAEKSYWVDACRSTLPLPVDYPTGSNTAADSHELTVRLSVQETTDLRVISQSVPTILLTGLAQTLKQWSQQDTTLVDVEGHGRYVWDKALDISRTVGWFTALYPLRLQLSPSATLNEQLNTVQKQLDKVPNGGLGYGVLRCAEQGEVPELTSAAEVSFNYLGQLALDTAGFITSLVFEPVPAVKSLEHVCKYRFEIVALIEVDQLQIRWCYSQQQYQHSTVEQLAQRLINNLKSLIACHRQPEKKEPAATSFTAARVDDAQLSQLMSKLNAREASAS
ncbi:MAG: condensation domain-containing protein [Phormidesmis sp.]